MRSKVTRLLKHGLALGVVLALFAAGCGEEGSEPRNDPGKSLASAAGCDVNRSDVPLIQTELDYAVEPGKPIGKSSVEDAVVPLYRELRENGATFSEEELAGAARKASTTKSAIEVRLPGVMISVERWDDGSYLATGYVQCA